MNESIPTLHAAGTPDRETLEPPRPKIQAGGTGAVTPAALPGNPLAGFQPTGYLGPATVLESDPRARLALVQWSRAGQPCLSWARPAVAASPALKPGDETLVLSQNLEDFYIVGLLTEKAPPQPEVAALETRAGARVTVAPGAGGEVLQLRSRQGALVVEYHPESGKTVVNVEDGDLEFVTRRGSIAFKSAQTISLSAPRLETEANTVVAKADNVYQTVAELSQLQTGRMRTLVEGTCLLKARDAFLKAEQDFKVDGQQIHLG
jgi:hypothetical protein